MSLIDEAALERRMREIARAESARPEFVHQRIVERVVGIPGRQYLRDARDRRFATAKERRLVIARTADVLEYYGTRIATARPTPSNDANVETIAFARVGARRVAR